MIGSSKSKVDGCITHFLFFPLEVTLHSLLQILTITTYLERQFRRHLSTKVKVRSLQRNVFAMGTCQGENGKNGPLGDT